MKIQTIGEMKRGWFIGDFEPSVLRTDKFEVGMVFHRAGEQWPTHYHEHSTEMNVLVRGRMMVNGDEIIPGMIFTIAPYESATPDFIEDCLIVVVRDRSIPNDKVEGYFIDPHPQMMLPFEELMPFGNPLPPLSKILL